ncbi:DUF6498-containing protein [Natronolimnobius baerhuensis]|uniref:Uncharacterized protein n=1 Tax=Natronolimnobius baerhuensis TaxID=253108 RepID=A0A202E5L7_9EURY|nr:DUF6498-containing protein [Natronolimnobius baerhuensis]OVE83468.1 hypothetical protein B2G88_13565 [Natronolimnobius baerhuensis]
MSPTSKRSQTAFVWVILANLASLAVIWWYDWQAHALLLVYWLETAVIAMVYAAKIRRAEGTDDPRDSRSWTKFAGRPAEWYIGKSNAKVADGIVLTFIGPWLLTGAVILVIPLIEDLTVEFASLEVVVLAAASLVGYHCFSYWITYVGRREYERRGPVSLLVEPGPYLWALLASVFVGLGATQFTRNPATLIGSLVFCKTCADLLAHRRERKRMLE